MISETATTVCRCFFESSFFHVSRNILFHKFPYFLGMCESRSPMRLHFLEYNKLEVNMKVFNHFKSHHRFPFLTCYYYYGYVFLPSVICGLREDQQRLRQPVCGE